MDENEENLLVEQLKTVSQKKICFWGASTFLFEFLLRNNLKDYNIIGIIDNNPKFYNDCLLSYKIYQPENLTEEPDVIIYTIKNNYIKVYDLIKKDVEKFFPNTKLLPNIFLNTKTDKLNLDKLVSNKIFIIDNNNNRIQVSYIPGLTVHWLGTNAIVEIKSNPLPRFTNCTFTCGNNTKISIGSTSYELNNLKIIIPSNFSSLTIGNQFSVNECQFLLHGEANQKITVGDDCMFSNGIIIRSADFHTVYDNLSKKVINFSRDITIHNHVWVCQNVTMLKGSIIPNNCIVGANSLVNKSFDKENSVISGNPAKITKQI